MSFSQIGLNYTTFVYGILSVWMLIAFIRVFEWPRVNWFNRDYFSFFSKWSLFAYHDFIFSVLLRYRDELKDGSTTEWKTIYIGYDRRKPWHWIWNTPIYKDTMFYRYGMELMSLRRVHGTHQYTPDSRTFDFYKAYTTSIPATPDATARQIQVCRINEHHSENAPDVLFESQPFSL